MTGVIARIEHGEIGVSVVNEWRTANIIIEGLYLLKHRLLIEIDH